MTPEPTNLAWRKIRIETSGIGGLTGLPGGAALRFFSVAAVGSFRFDQGVLRVKDVASVSQGPMSIHGDYTPLRNFIRRFPLESSLVDVWQYALHVIDREPLPSTYLSDRRSFQPMPLHPWQIETICREIVLNAERRGDCSLRRWNDLAKVINHVQRIENAAFTVDGRPMDVMIEMQRIAHRQFPWQVNNGVNSMVRAMKIFGTDAVNAVVQHELGMTSRQAHLLGMAVLGHFFGEWGMSTRQDYRFLGIADDARDAFFERLTISLPELREQLKTRQRFDYDWAYTWNPLEAKPLVRLYPDHPDRMICPIPRFLHRRTLGGLFFDLVARRDFSNPYGKSFEKYIGEVFGATCPAPKFRLLLEEPFYVGGQRKDGVDWILSDDTAHLFVEGKTKRVTLDAKSRSDTAALDRDLETIAKAVIQHYRNIQFALEGRTHWVPDGRPIYPLVLTLEDWFLISSTAYDMLMGHVRRLLLAENLRVEMLDEMPFTIASIGELETVAQIIAMTSIERVMAYKTAPSHRTWGLLNAVRMEFQEEVGRADLRLFGSEFDKILDGLKA
jgi:hypothetical protein